MPAPVPVHQQFNDEQKARVARLFYEGKTQGEIGQDFGKPARTIGKLLKHLGLRRTVSEAAYLANKSDLDNPDTVEQIKELRKTNSLQQIVSKVGGSISAVQRICDKYGIDVPDDYAQLQAARMEVAWTEEKRQEARRKAISMVTPELRAMLSQHSKELWDNPEYRINQITVQKEVWNRPENRERLAAFRTKQSNGVSGIQKMLYGMLDDLGVEYQPEFTLGPYNFDCRVGNLLIECQGDYWHSLEKAIRVDKAKATYVQVYFGDEYTLKYLWEHEFHCQDRVAMTLRHWLGVSDHRAVEYSFDDLLIETPSAKEYREFLTKYHYLSNAGRGGRAFGAYHRDVLIALCVFSPLVRQNIDTKGWEANECVELSRLCVHPSYQKQNVASWFVSRCLKQLPRKIKLIISYCDTTFNHDGAVYKALNFKQDKVIRPDYWYADERGWVMHKKTLYERAVKMSMKEAEYAQKYGYKKVFGTEKLRFVLERRHDSYRSAFDGDCGRMQ